MPQPLIGAKFAASGVPDYVEAPRQTLDRLTAAGKWEKARTHFHKARAAKKPGGAPRYPEFKGHQDDVKPKRYEWIRIHWPPDNYAEAVLLNPVETVVAAEAIPPLSCDPPIDEAKIEEVVTIPTVPPADGSKPLSEMGRSERQRVRNPIDNSYPIPKYVPKSLTIDEMLTLSNWAMDNVMHVAAGRVTMRDAPSAGAWPWVEWAMEDFKGLMKFSLDQIKKLADEQTAAKARLYDDDRELQRVLDELDKAEPVA